MIALEQQTSSHRSNNFDFLRFFLAALVIFSHSFDLLGGRGANPISQFTRGQIDGGSLAVDGSSILPGDILAPRGVPRSFQRPIRRESKS
jgi:hypothetical protein